MNKYKELFLTTTDTVVGMGAPISETNKDVIYELKNRDYKKPLIIMVGSIDQARAFKEWDSSAEKLAVELWPGSTTLILSEKIALRMPGSEKLCELLTSIGPCYMTSANISGQKTLSFKEAKEVFKEINIHYDFGEGSGKPSTIIDVKTRKKVR